VILFFDTETSDLPDFDKRASDPSQPHLVQMAAILTDESAREIECHKMLAKPDGWVMSPEAVARHGITPEFAASCGVAEYQLILTLFCMIERASLIVGHNIQLDKFMARIAARRFELLPDARDAWWKAIPQFCTMKSMTNVCRLAGGRGCQFKWPKLQEAYQHAFGRPFEGAHDSLADVRATKDIYFWLHDRNRAAEDTL
jgi:DNA polymerase-3 subunit epsilon